MIRLLIQVLLVLASTTVAVHAASPIAGGWYTGPGYPSNNGVVVTFFDDGTYYMAEDGVADDGGGPGMERGTYVFDQAATSLSTTTIDDTSGDWGLSHATVTSAALNGDTLTVKIVGEPFPIALTRVADPGSAIVGSWYTGPSSFPRDDGVVITFLAHGNYFLAEDGIADGGGGPGMERGDYVWDGASAITFNGGGLQGMPWRDTNGDWGLSHANVLGITVNGDQLTVSSEGEADILFFRVPAAPIPEPSSWVLMLAAMCMLAARVGAGRSSAVRSH